MTALPEIGGWGEEVEGPRSGSLEWRASLALKILAGIIVAGILLAMIPGAIPASEFHAAAFNMASGALAVLYVMVAWALDRRQDWAVSAIRPLLIVLLVWGTYSFFTTFAGGAVRIPFTTIAAGWALLGSADHKPLPRPRRRSVAVLGASAALIALIVAGEPLFGWGGFFDVHERDLSASLTVDCGTPGAAPPERITISYDWSWSGGTLLPNEADEVVIGWNGDNAAGHPLYVLADDSEPGNGVHLGSLSVVNTAMAEEAARRWRGSLRWGIDLRVWGIRPGRIELVLQRAAEQSSGPQSLAIGATYIHVGTWQNEAPPVTCSW